MSGSMKLLFKVVFPWCCRRCCLFSVQKSLEWNLVYNQQGNVKIKKCHVHHSVAFFSVVSGKLGALRLKVRLVEDRILPSVYYQPLIHLLVESVISPAEVRRAVGNIGLLRTPNLRTGFNGMLRCLLTRWRTAALWPCWRRWPRWRAGRT